MHQCMYRWLVPSYAWTPNNLNLRVLYNIIDPALQAIYPLDKVNKAVALKCLIKLCCMERGLQFT